MEKALLSGRENAWIYHLRIKPQKCHNFYKGGREISKTKILSGTKAFIILSRIQYLTLLVIRGKINCYIMSISAPYFWDEKYDTADRNV